MTTTEAIKNPNATLIDVREPYELETDGVIDGAINIPLGEVPQKLEEIKEMPKPLVFFCRSGNRSATAAQFMQENGVEEVYNGGGAEEVNEILKA
ncbi:rhodanese-like domain-containing protein [Weeksella virosa]|uniref:rhodanese-like domain-containing protein n=1 Tax=Weeksella virosa TaxID=1014 RepID=UPI000DF86CC5|nr:rhodanese-like domain-containing protein [Weeksella virosa]MDK7375142.1 rhodanese-like domain-containing protein [Weeksella virosa]MDK7675833.1 rhodanese-like domain-containing protein [Weeksella virosa]SUP55042.1 Thiosulfate sulfurtransferase PspE precursor [Weeksella virosa]